MMTPKLTPYNDTQVKVEFEYRKEAVEQIKSEIPGPGRKWDAQRKCWIVQNDFADYASDILMTVFGEIDIDPEVYRRIKEMRDHKEGK
ncbi:MAG: hypothetical protein ACYDHW_07105 [Syntrophorhabdaceae bacterium]